MTRGPEVQGIIDHEARKDAALANQKIDSHEDKCSERWSQANKSLTEVKGDVKDIHHRINTLIRMMFGCLVALLGFALVQWLSAKGLMG